MQAILSQLIAQLNSSVLILLGILVVAIWTVYNLGKWKERFFAHDKRLDKVESIHDTVVELKTVINLIYNNTNPKKLFASASPVGLTEFGKEIASKIKAEEIFRRYLKSLVAMVNEKCPNKANAYDIQDISMNIGKKELQGLMKAEEINLLKTEAFERGLLVDDIFAIFGIYLRDHVLAARNIAPAEIDKHDPEMKK